MRAITYLSLALLMVGCSTVSTNQRPDSYYDSSRTGNDTASLFTGDASVLSDEAIGSILDYRYEPPELARVALMPFGREQWSKWSEELAVATQDLERDVLANLQGSPRVYDASYLPSILVPESRTVPHLREAAARYQADLLLVYRSYCRTFDRYRFLQAPKARAYCGVEAVLLDTRTGLVPFTTVAFESYEVSRSKDDSNFQETVLKAQLASVGKAMTGVANEIRGFLDAPDT